MTGIPTGCRFVRRGRSLTLRDAQLLESRVCRWERQVGGVPLLNEPEGAKPLGGVP